MEQISHDVRRITGVCESCLSQGALLRAEVQGAEGGQGDAGIPHQVVGRPRPVPCHRYELQSGRERAALPFLGEEGDGIAIPIGEVYHRPCDIKSGDCGTFKGDGEVLPIQIRLI